MGKTIAEKILARASGQGAVSPGDIVWVNVDIAMMDDILGPRVQIAEKMLEIKDQVWEPDKVVIIADHYTPPASIDQAEIVKFTRDWAADHGISHYYEYVGPCHQIMAEQGYVKPGTVILGTDSHTCTGGAFGAFATGIGSTEMMGVLITGKTWLRVPETIRVQWEGTLPPGALAKDISLKTIQTIGHAGATYKSIEYTGSAIRALEMDERMCICNMAVEMGAKVGFVPPDEKTVAYLLQQSIVCDSESLICSDVDAGYCAEYHFDASTLVPQVACPHQVDNVFDIGALYNIPIQQAHIGSCTGGRLSDIAAAAEILRGRKIARGTRLLVSPASQQVWKKADDAGYLAALAEAGATILGPTCGVCVGLHSGMLAAKENCVSTTNRNFIGRMGSKEAGIYLASAYTVASSAVTGYLTDPRDFL